MVSVDVIFYTHVFPGIFSIFFLFVSVLSVLWLAIFFWKKGVFKNVLSLQRKISLFILLHSIVRFLQYGLLTQMCTFDERGLCGNLPQSKKPFYISMGKIQMWWDLAATWLNFCIFGTLAGFWAESAIGDLLRDKVGYKVVKVVIALVSVGLELFALLILLVANAVILFTDTTWSSMWFLIFRAVYRVVLSSFCALLLIVFSMIVWTQKRTGDSIRNIFFATLICGFVYLLLSTWNLVSLLVFEPIGKINRTELAIVSLFTFTLFSSLELAANGILLFTLTPSGIVDLFCWNRSKNHKKRMLKRLSAFTASLDTNSGDEGPMEILPYDEEFGATLQETLLSDD